MPSTVIHIAAVMAGLALVASGFAVFPGAGMKGLAKGLSVAISLAVVAAVLITAARSFGP